MRFILASASPRRKELLTAAGFEYEVRPADIDETIPSDTPTELVAEFLSRKKALSVLEKNPDAVVLGSDTIVVLDGSILGKPHDTAEASDMLHRLSGKAHRVYTGVCVCSSEKTLALTSFTDVYFRKLSDKLIDAYIATGEPMDKAGAYGAQGLGSTIIKKIDGDFFTVMGLPIADTARLLSEFGVVGALPMA